MDADLVKSTAGLLIFTGIATSCQQSLNNHPKPNLILIVADDLGYGDLGCYGQKLIQTPNIDRMAGMGMVFNRHYAGCTVSAPSRSCLLTGKHTGHTFIRGNLGVGKEGQYPLAQNCFTLPEMLREEGYVTGAFGKWGLGMPGNEGDPLNQGFKEFFGYMCQGYAHRYYPKYLWSNRDTFFLEGNDWTVTQTYAPDLIHEKTLDFITRNKDSSFFLFIPSILPHAELVAPDDSLMIKYKGKFPEKPFGERTDEFPYSGNDYGDDNFDIYGYSRQKFPRTVFASMVSRLDLHVGEIISHLEKLGIAENTVIIFTSDNGPHKEGGADPVFFNSAGGLRGIKRDLYEGGIRVPMIVYWPGKINPGSVSDHICAFWDIMPTLAEIAGTSAPEDLDGISFLPVLMEKGTVEKHDYLYWEFHEQGGKIAILQDPWKLIRLNASDSSRMIHQLFNISEDPMEQTDLSERFPAKVSELQKIMLDAHNDSEIFPLKVYP